MAMKFKTEQDRDAFAKRLMEHAAMMMQCCDQGANGTIRPTVEMIDDIRAAAAVVATSDIRQ